MLKKIIVALSFVLSLSAYACWKVEGQLSVDGEDWKINQKVDHGKEYSFPLGNFILNMTLNSKDKNQSVHYALFEKKGIKRVLITKGEEALKINIAESIYAKGEEGQPNSIITLKLTDI